MNDLPGLGSYIPNPSCESGPEDTITIRPGRVILGKCCKRKVTVHFQRLLHGRGGLSEQPVCPGLWAALQSKPHVCTAPLWLVGCCPHGEVHFAYKKINA